uniref:Si:dkey-181c13.1 n=1 Tax=Cyprinus carpio carpio TaxID=630221 RepID=A0A9J7WZK1_CYPCA
KKKSERAVTGVIQCSTVKLRDKLNVEHVEKSKQEQKHVLDNTFYIVKFVFTDGWIYHEFSYYYISSEKKNWTESRKRGADLLIVNNNEEQNISGKNVVWIGLTDSDVEGRWKWVNGSTLTYGFWASGRPNNYNGNEDCALSYISWWYDCSCNSVFKWICEMSILHIVLF